MSPQM